VASETEKLTDSKAGTRRIVRIVALSIGVALAALIVDQVLWLVPVARYGLTVSGFDSRCSSIKEGMDRGAVIAVMNGIGSEEYLAHDEIGFIRQWKHTAHSCIVVLDSMGRVRAVKNSDTSGARE
jgi:hypothetical protein